MHRWMGFLLALAMVWMIGCGTVSAGAEETIRREISYPGENYTFAIPAGYTSMYRENFGMVIMEREEILNHAYTRLQILPGDPGFSADSYFESELMPYLRSMYNSEYARRLIDEGTTQAYTIGGRQMTGRVYKVKVNSQIGSNWVVFDNWDGKIFRYEANWYDDDMDASLELLLGVVRSVTKPALAPKATKQSLSTVTCAEQGFTIQTGKSYPRTFSKQNGLTVYTGKEGSIPYIMVYQGNDLIMEPYEYLREQYTPHMKEEYGKNYVTESVFPHVLIGGKDLPGAEYVYKVQNYYVHMMRIMDSTGKRTVVYTAKYIGKNGEKALAALDAAIRSFRSTR